MLGRRSRITCAATMWSHSLTGSPMRACGAAVRTGVVLELNDHFHVRQLRRQGSGSSVVDPEAAFRINV